MDYIEEIKRAWADNEKYSIVDINVIGLFRASGTIKHKESGQLIKCSLIQCCGAITE